MANKTKQKTQCKTQCHETKHCDYVEIKVILYFSVVNYLSSCTLAR